MANLQTNKVKNLIKFRPRDSMIIPYIEIPLPSEKGSLVIDEVFVGPSREIEISMASVNLLLKAKNVICSKVDAFVKSLNCHKMMLTH